MLLAPPPHDREEAIDARRRARRRSSAAPSTSTRTGSAPRAGRVYDRGYNPAGIGRQLLGHRRVAARAPRACAELDVPTLVIHGDGDPLVDASAAASAPPRSSPAPSCS